MYQTLVMDLSITLPQIHLGFLRVNHADYSVDSKIYM